MRIYIYIYMYIEREIYIYYIIHMYIDIRETTQARGARGQTVLAQSGGGSANNKEITLTKTTENT